MKQSLIDDLLRMANVAALAGPPQTPDEHQTNGLVRSLGRPADSVGEAILRYKSGFAVAVAIDAADLGGRIKNLREVVNFVDRTAEFGATATERALRLDRWCRTFGPKTLLARTQRSVIKNLNLAREMIDEIYDSGQTVSTAFRDYCRKVATAAENVYAMREALGTAGKGKSTTYNVIHFLYQNGLSYENLTADNIKNVFDMAFKAPPSTKFAGVGRWGAGNHGSVEENKKMHFYKHCLDAHPDVKEKSEWLDECGIWWEKLKIDLDYETARDKLPPPLFSRIDPLYTDKKKPLSYAAVPKAVAAARATGGWGEPMLRHLYDTFGGRYVASAIDMTRDMEHVMVHGDVKKKYAVMLKGIHGRFFIGSRIENDDLTISTCFVPRPDVNLATVNEERKLWDIN